MTRETKIGLLVGLAFIIVIGILLSDYNRIETQSTAPLYGALDNVRQSTSSPGTSESTGATVVVPPVVKVAPRHAVPMRDEVNGSRDAQGGAAVIEVRPGASNPVPAVTSHQPASTSSDDGSEIVIGPGTNTESSSTGASEPSNVPEDLRSTSARNGEELVPVTPRNDPHPVTSDKPTSAQKVAPPFAASAGRQYTAVSGDTLSKLAGRFMGGNTKANRDAIVKANPSLQKNPNVIVAGRAYLIPAGAASVASATTATATESRSAKPSTAQPTATIEKQPGQPTAYWYTVRENDSLWKIAQDQLGDGNAYAAIKELNKDILKGKDDVHPKMRLRLPAKPLASAN